MAEIYGHKWISSYGEKPNHAWISGLRDVSPEKIKYGIESIIKSGESWPPSLPEFIDYCIGISRDLVIAEIHNRYVDRMSTYSQIERLERTHFKEVKSELIDITLWDEKQIYLNQLDDKQLKALVDKSK